MQIQQINRFSAKFAFVLSMVAFVTVLIGYTQPPLPDEGALAHIFQLSVAALVLLTMIFLATTDWQKPWQILRHMVVPFFFTFLAFGALYYLENHYYLEPAR